jgi:type I restriction-modification system DNA methylase subunit
MIYAKLLRSLTQKRKQGVYKVIFTFSEKNQLKEINVISLRKMNYQCDLCKKNFGQKIELTRHKNKKSPCITLTEMQQISQIKEVKIDDKNKLSNVFKNCLNILRDSEGLTGEKALRTMSYLLILKLLEPHFGGQINIDDYDYDFSHIEDQLIEKHKNKLLELVRFSNLSNEKEDNIPVNMKYLWDDILSNHPTTKNIFLKGKGFDIEHKSTYKKLIDKLNLLDLSQTQYDVLGNAYEEVIQDIMTGKILGQYFTPPLVKKMMVELINPQIHADGKIDTCVDPTMGTGGFLITYLQHILKQATSKNINPDWDFIKTQGLYGKEIEPDTYQLSVSNMLISSGHMFENLDRGDSIRVPITRKFDNVLSNPPFGIKGLKHDDIPDGPVKCECFPIKSDKAVSLFIQEIIYMLNVNGKCAVVLPDGEDLFSKTNKTLIAIREYLMKTCDLKEITYLPSGIFTHTSIKTCVFYFIKKKMKSDVLETIIKVSKTQKVIGRYYKFSKIHQTSKVKFYDYNPYEDVKNLLVEVGIDDISKNSYSLNYTEYIKDESEEQYEEGVVVKTLGEICKFLAKSKRRASYGKKQGIYPFYTSSQTCSKYCDKYDYEDECLIIGTGGTANIKYSSKFSCSADNFVIKINTCLGKYVYYYLFSNIDLLQKGFVGSGLQHISKEYINNIEIPIPRVERQQEIIKKMDDLNDLNKKLEEQIKENIKNSTQIISDMVIKSIN